jgi:hypothetical protein
MVDDRSVVVEVAGSDVAGCVFAARCSRQRGVGGGGQQRAAAAVGGNGSPEIDDWSDVGSSGLLLLLVMLVSP